MLTVIDFFADWCGPCKMMTPVLEQVENELAGKVTFEKVNVDEQSEKASQYGVMSIPTFVILKEGNEIDRLVGYVPKEEFKKRLKLILDNKNQ